MGALGCNPKEAIHQQKEAKRPRNRRGRLAGALDWRCVDGGDFKAGDALSHGPRLPIPLIREVQPRRAPGQDDTRLRRQPVTDEENKRWLTWFRAQRSQKPGQARYDTLRRFELT